MPVFPIKSEFAKLTSILLLTLAFSLFTGCGGDSGGGNNNNNDGTQQTYTVAFNSNGGTFGDASIRNVEVNSGERVSAPAAPTRIGHNFDDWYTTSDFTEKAVFPITVTRDITLYARWIPKIYTVTFDSKGGSFVPPINVEHGGVISAPTPVPTRDGY